VKHRNKSDNKGESEEGEGRQWQQEGGVSSSGSTGEAVDIALQGMGVRAAGAMKARRWNRGTNPPGSCVSGGMG
jgi:hypothetical protein